jgi:YD repeat-containing protein
MKPIKIKNEYNETIELKWDEDGNIQVRHSDIDKEHFGKFHEFAKRSRQPQIKESLKGKGIDANNPQAKELLEKMGGYLVIHGETFFINAEETAMILEAVKQHGGIVPNWSSQP